MRNAGCSLTPAEIELLWKPPRPGCPSRRPQREQLSRKGLETGRGVWEFYTMNAVKVNSAKRIRLTVLTPGDYYEPELRGRTAEEITLRRMPPPRRRFTKLEALKCCGAGHLAVRTGRAWGREFCNLARHWALLRDMPMGRIIGAGGSGGSGIERPSAAGGADIFYVYDDQNSVQPVAAGQSGECDRRGE